MSWLDQSGGSSPFACILGSWKPQHSPCLPLPSGLKFCVFQINFIHLFLIHLPQLIMVFVLQEIFNNEKVIFKSFLEKGFCPLMHREEGLIL